MYIQEQSLELLGREGVKPKDGIWWWGGGYPHITVLKVILLNEFLRRENVTREKFMSRKYSSVEILALGSG